MVQSSIHSWFREGCAEMKTTVIFAAVAASLMISATGVSAPKTTAPSKKVLVQVIINDKGIILRMFQILSGDRIDVMVGPVPRGDYLSFQVLNRGNRAHNFAIFGKKTSRIKPGHKAHLFAVAKSRGSYPYRSTLDASKGFRGLLTVY
jgi:hypothetical protein